ncbi:hypothetical protein K8W59_04695 [Nocardioides rotundus]|uniref:hypothetical protein n=1 Tax=Nocardioides rotundus TaxID=1774216 RepID=UPI001CBD4412|nr:hypothetical protein [Nocardioides rotundus]UAL30806.1 hypothetical protein K8W59_04695 [Nocardioides rotundus]
MREVRRLLAVAVTAGLFGVAACGGGGASSSSAPSPSPSTSAPSGSAPALELTLSAAPPGRCVPPTADALRRLAEHAFAGRVVEAAGGRVVLRAEEWFHPSEAPDRVVVAGGGGGRRTTAGAPSLVAGERYLVAANADGRVLACGLSGPDAPALRQLYASAF